MSLTASFIRRVAFPLMERMKGNRIRTIQAELEKIERWPIKRLHEYRQNKLRALLIHSFTKVRAYEQFEELLLIAQNDPVKALREVPILSKEKFMKNRKKYVADGIEMNQLIQNRTGGSTGKPVKFYLDRHTVEHYEAARWRSLSWHGIRIGDPSVMIWGSPIELSKRQLRRFTWKERWLKNRFIIPAFHLNKKTISHYVKRIQSFHPVYVYGYASALYTFALLIEEIGAKLPPSIRGVVSTAETLMEEQRETIERIFQCPVINEYGARDGGMIAYECEEGNMHLQAENVWIETVDLQTDDEVNGIGRLLVTDLNNFSMPRLRYELGDVGELTDSECRCGRSLPLLQQLAGRLDDVFVKKDGSYVHGQFFAHLIRKMNSVKQYQIVQHSVNKLTIKLVLHRHARAIDDEKNALVQKVKSFMGNPTVHVKTMEAIPPSPSGKVRLTIREMPLPH